MQTITILGAGTMGHGIAQVAAATGYGVRLFDVQAEALARAEAAVRRSLDEGVARGKVSAEARAACLANLTFEQELAAACADADLVVEAVPERLALKQQVLAAAEAASPSSAILATNTSSLSIDRIAEALQRPERFLGTHFFNPVPVMKLLELVRGAATDEAVVDGVRAFGERIGKTVIVVRDAPGFATSRLGVCLGMEAIRMVEQGVASPEDIDTAMVLGYRHPIGPLRLTDLVGLDVRMAIGSYLAEELGNPAFEPPELMRRMVAEGRLGKKSGEGFYRWED
jgi:3-hydroxybutyryl-CoA dehydrogenase